MSLFAQIGSLKVLCGSTGRLIGQPQLYGLGLSIQTFLWDLCQMDIGNKSNGFGKRSVSLQR